MTLAHVPLFVVILLIPYSTWNDWKSAPAPHLQNVLRTGSIALMNCRTAEQDKITTEAGIRTLFAGARMNANGDTSKLLYPADPNNLTDALPERGFALRTVDALASSLIQPRRADGAGVAIVKTESSILQADSDLAQLQAWVKITNGVLLVASPSPSPQEYKNCDQLTPIVIWRPNQIGHLLTSASTRQPGLVTNTDFAPTIAAIVGAKLHGPSYGTVMTSVSPDEGSTYSVLSKLSQESASLDKWQLCVPYIATLIALTILFFSWSILTDRRRMRQYVANIAALCGFVLIFNGRADVLIALVAGLYYLFSAHMSFDRTLGKAQHDRPLKAFSSLLVCLICLDALFNHCELTSTSLLGYSFSDGSRYYGLGNEAMGELIGATVILTGWIAEKAKRLPWGVATWMGVAFILGHPDIGAKAGGMLVALVALSAYLAANFPMPNVSRPAKIALTFGLPIAVGLAALVALSHFGGSHVSQTMGQAKEHGSGVILSVIVRKAAMDFHLAFHSIWMLVLIASAGGTYLIDRKSGSLDHPGYRSVLLTGWAATAACLLLNDAGVVAAALCMIYSWSYVADASLRGTDMTSSITQEKTPVGAI